MSYESNSPLIQHTISIHQVIQIVIGIEDRAQRDALLTRAGINPALLKSDLARVTQRQFARLMRLMVRGRRDELWGLCSQPVPLGTLATACRFMATQPFLGQALRHGLRYYHALLPDFVPRLQVSNGVAYVRLSPRGSLKNPQHYGARAFVFLGYGVMCWLVARRIPVSEVVYQSSFKAPRSEASQLFQAPIRLENDDCGLRFDAKWLDLPIVQNSQSVEEFLKQVPECLLLRYRDQASSTERIRRVLRRYLSEEMPTLEEVSRMLATTPQTLRRRLRREGHGYQQVKDALRRDVAVDYLVRSELSLAEIASKVGFSEASTFHRAFKAWTGLSPGAYRDAHQVPNPGVTFCHSD